MPTRSAAAADGDGLRRALGLLPLTLFALGMILGAGIYSVVGAAAGEAAEALWQSFLLAGIVATITGLSYAELATMMPKAGAEFVYLAAALPRVRLLAVVVALLVVISGIATVATVAIAFAGYLRDLLGWSAGVDRTVAPALIAACALVALLGIVESAWVNAIFTVIEVAGLVLLVVVATGSPAFGDALAALPTSGMVGAASLAFFAFLGFESIVTLAEESRAPERDIPRAILLSLGTAIVLYVAVAIGAVALLEPAALADSDAPLADAVAGPAPVAARALGAIALFATANTALGSLIASSRLLYGIAREQDIPAWLGQVARRRRTPWAAILLCAVVAGSLTLPGRIPLVASLSSLASLIAFFAVHAALIVLRLRAPQRKRPFRVPGAIGRVPVLPVVGALGTVILAVALEREAHVAGLVAIGAAVLLALAPRAWRWLRR